MLFYVGGLFFSRNIKFSFKQAKVYSQKSTEKIKKKSDINMKFFQAWAKCCFT